MSSNSGFPLSMSQNRPGNAGFSEDVERVWGSVLMKLPKYSCLKFFSHQRRTGFAALPARHLCAFDSSHHAAAPFLCSRCQRRSLSNLCTPPALEYSGRACLGDHIARCQEDIWQFEACGLPFWQQGSANYSAAELGPLGPNGG